MGNSNNKRVNSFLKHISENDIKGIDRYNELFNLREDFQNDGDFFEIYKNIKSRKNITSLFEFLIYTFNKCTQDPNEKNISECKFCLQIALCTFPCIQYNYKNKDIFKLLWERDSFDFTVYGLKYSCDNILILHLFNLLLILLFTENLCIKKCCNKPQEESESRGGLAKNTVDMHKLWEKYTLIENIEEQKYETDIKKEKKEDKEPLWPVKNDSNGTKNTILKENNLMKQMDIQDKNGINEKEVKQNKLSKESEVIENGPNIMNDQNHHSHKEEVLQSNSIDLELIKNRIDILKCLLILLSTYVYFDHSTYLKEKNYYLFFFTSGEICYTSNFFLSLINVIYDNEFNYFNSFFFNDLYIEYYNLCLLILNILIDFRPYVIKGEKQVHYMNKAVNYFYNLGKIVSTKKLTTLDADLDIEKKKEMKETLDKENMITEKEQLENVTESNQDLTINGTSNTAGNFSKDSSYSSFPSNSSFKTVTFLDTSEKSCSSSDNGERDNENNKQNIESKSNDSGEKKNSLFSKKEKIVKGEYFVLSEEKEVKEYFGVNNVFYDMFRQLRIDSMKYIYGGILNMLISFKMYSETYEEDLPFLENYIFLLWHLVDHNVNFIKYLKTHNSNIFLYYIFYLLLFFNNCRKKEIQKCATMKKEKKQTLQQVSKINIHRPTEEESSQEEDYEHFYHNKEFLKSDKCDEFGVRKIDGLIHICLFIMMKISSKRIICKKLNENCIQNSKRKINFLKHIDDFNTYADFLIYTFCTLINDNIYFLKFERIVDMSLTILTNISVYIKSMGVISCDCIIAVLKKILKKEWILSSEHHFYSLFLLLDFINNILSYNLYENYNLVYTIIKNKNVFFFIHNLHNLLKSCCYPDTPSSAVYWMPTEKWLFSWKDKLPLDFINGIIYDLANRVEEECNEKEILNYDEVVSIIKDHCKIIVNKKIPFVIRKYDKDISLLAWFTNYLYFLAFSYFYKHNLFINNGVTFIF